jgi:triosephosphate isomerase
MLKAVGLKYVLIGHSERRQYFGETDKPSTSAPSPP